MLYEVELCAATAAAIFATRPPPPVIAAADSMRRRPAMPPFTVECGNDKCVPFVLY